MSFKTKDKRYLARDVPPKSIEIIKSEASFLLSSNGKKYIDFSSGWCVGNLGWGHKQIKKNIRKFDGPDYVSPSFLYKPWADLAELLAKITPGKLIKSFRATGGSEAVEIALRAANAFTKRNQFISIEGSYHGDTIGAMSVGSSYFRSHHSKLLFASHKISPPLDDIKLKKIEQLLAHENIAAFIMEPIICNLAVVIPEKEFMNQLGKLCHRYGTLLIIDEVATGFGRTGKMFASEYFNLKPDIMCLAKAITGGYAPMGATITTSEVAKAMEFDSSYYSSYGWYPLSVQAALANINYLLDHQVELQRNIQRISELFKQRLSEMKFRGGVDIRIIGLAIGLEFEIKNYAKEIVEKARKKGLLIPLHSEHELTIFPALNIHQKVANEGLDILERCV